MTEEIYTRIWGNEPLMLWINKYASDSVGERSRSVMNPYRAAFREHLKLIMPRTPASDTFNSIYNLKRNLPSDLMMLKTDDDPQLDYNLKDRKSVVSKLVETLGLPQSKVEKMIDLELKSLP